jgi:hypothetical protein
MFSDGLCQVWPRFTCAQKAGVPDAAKGIFGSKYRGPITVARTHDESSAHVFSLNMFRMQGQGLLLLSMVIFLGIQKARLERPT